MRKCYRICIALVALLWLVSFVCAAQENFQVKWSMDYTQAGTSSHPNFTPANASLQGGANTFTLPTVYSPGGAVVVGYIVRPWPTKSSAGRFMEFTFQANSFKYNISEISFRLRRSGDGPNLVRVRTSMDGFAADIATPTVAGSGQFYAYSVPVHFANLSGNSFTIRIYAHNSASIYGTLWFDEIIIGGKVLPIILPVFLSDWRIQNEENAVRLAWETSREINTKAFVIERSADLDTFKPIGTVNAAGESSEPVQYEFVDLEPAPGISYYRLRCVDGDESFSFSKTLDVVRSRGSDAFYVFPNPASPESIMVGGDNLAAAAFRLTSAAGLSIPFKCSLNDLKRMILTPDQPLTSGIYVLSDQNNTSKEPVRIIVR